MTHDQLEGVAPSARTRALRRSATRAALPARPAAPPSAPARPSDDATPLAEQVAAAVTAVPGVHALHPGRDGLAMTLLPGRWVTGVRLHLDGCDIHVVMAWEASVGATRKAVRAAVGPLIGGTVDVTVADIAPPAGHSSTTKP